MLIWDVLTALGRRWYIALAGVVITAGVLGVVQTQAPVYYSRAQVYFLAPSSTLNPNVLRVASLDLVTAAGVVAKRINGTGGLPATASMDVTLVGRGIHDGSGVRLPDNGGQWSVSYDRQSIDVEVTAATPREVSVRQRELFARIRAELHGLQAALEVPAANLVSTEVVPSEPTILEVTGERRRAQAMTLAVGGVATALAIGSVEVGSRRRRSLRA